MNVTNLAIAAVWAFFLGCALFRGVADIIKPPPPTPFSMPAAFAIMIFGVVSVISFLLAFFVRRRIRQGEWYTDWIDRKWGAGTYEAFLERFRPARMIMITALIIGTFSLLSLLSSFNQMIAIRTLFSLAAGLGLLAAYLLSHRFPPRVL